MKDIKSNLQLIAGRLAPQGLLIIAIPNNDSLQARLFGPRWLHLDVPRHLYHTDPGSLRFSLETAGFHVYKSRHDETEYNLIRWSQSAMNYTPLLTFFSIFSQEREKIIWYGPEHQVFSSVPF